MLVSELFDFHRFLQSVYLSSFSAFCLSCSVFAVLLSTLSEITRGKGRTNLFDIPLHPPILALYLCPKVVLELYRYAELHV